MTRQLGKTLQTYLPEGTPSGIRIAEQTTRIAEGIRTTILEECRGVIDAPTKKKA